MLPCPRDDAMMFKGHNQIERNTKKENATMFMWFAGFMLICSSWCSLCTWAVAQHSCGLPAGTARQPFFLLDMDIGPLQDRSMDRDIIYIYIYIYSIRFKL
jgi:hypothetical protein